MTLLDKARKGVTPEIRSVAKAEGLDPEAVRSLVASGRAVIPRNARRTFEPVGVGEGLRVKVNVNLGTSADLALLSEELAKVEVAERYGADAVMDLSTGGDVDAIRRRIIRETGLMVGTVPIYQAGLISARESAVVDMTSDDIFNSIRKHARDGVDFMTVHCGVTRGTVEILKRTGRVTSVVSRGGAFLAAWILHNGEENPLNAEFDYLLEMAREDDFTLSLGDGLRPGSIADASDAAQIAELITLGGLIKRARNAGVQAMVEGPGHVPLHQIDANVRLEKAVCDGAPFYVLGPLVTDIAPGYDHITAAIGGAVAGAAGADFLCYVTPAEHLSLPTVDDVREGLIATKIAAHAADLSRGRDWERDLEMSKARCALDWERMFKLAMDGDKCRAYRKRRSPADEGTCSMCGDACAIKMVKDHLDGSSKTKGRAAKRNKGRRVRKA